MPVILVDNLVRNDSNWLAANVPLMLHFQRRDYEVASVQSGSVSGQIQVTCAGVTDASLFVNSNTNE